ncbi:syntaxin-112-like [Silene latifolia]|uniref:syntaxin-112-like n=1 Tax=Silene latifolia TaxID=37657 RepID=UPI003D78941A
MNDLMTKSFLNYADLKKQVIIDIEAGISSEAETGEQMSPADQHNLSLFFQEIDSVKSKMEEISTLLNDLESLNQESKTIHSTKLLRGLRDRMDTDTVSILGKVKSLKYKLETLDRENTSNRKKSVSFREGSIVDRTRVGVTNGLRIKFKDMISEFTGLRDRIMNDHRADLRRKYFNATGEVPSDEVVEKLMSGSVKIEAFEGRIMMGGDTDLEEKERYEVVRDIQRSLSKLQQVFLDMAVLIDKQGEQIDDIEQNVVNAKEFISGGTNNLHYAKQMKKKNRWVYLVWAVGFIILLVCFISVLASR